MLSYYNALITIKIIVHKENGGFKNMPHIKKFQSKKKERIEKNYLSGKKITARFCCSDSGLVVQYPLGLL